MPQNCTPRVISLWSGRGRKGREKGGERGGEGEGREGRGEGREGRGEGEGKVIIVNRLYKPVYNVEDFYEVIVLELGHVTCLQIWSDPLLHCLTGGERERVMEGERSRGGSEREPITNHP